MRGTGNGRGLEGPLFQCKETFRQPVELRAELLDDTPLLGKLVGEFLDRLGLVGDVLLQPGDAPGRFGKVGHGLALLFDQPGTSYSGCRRGPQSDWTSAPEATRLRPAGPAGRKSP